MRSPASACPSGPDLVAEKHRQERERRPALAAPGALPDHELWDEQPRSRAPFPSLTLRLATSAWALILVGTSYLLCKLAGVARPWAAPLCMSSWVDFLPLPRSPLVPPSSDDFYKAPFNLTLYTPGDVLAWRQVHSSLPALQFPQARRMVQLSYATTDTQSALSHSVATLYEPLPPPTAPDALDRLLVVTVWEDAVSLDCSPSWALRVGGANGQSVLADTAVVIGWALSRGWRVLVPDHEGPNSAFAAGWQEGAAALDAVRAALAWASLDTTRSSVALWGYSGGGHAAAWAAQRHKTYAPDIPIVGAAMGGVPTDLAALAFLIDGGPFAGFVAAGLAGLGAAHPELELWVQDHARPSLSAVLSWLRSGVCLLPELSALAGRNIQSGFTIADPLGQPIPARVLQRESLLSPMGGGGLPPPSFPRYIWHALHDEVVPYAPVAEWVAAQCLEVAQVPVDTATDVKGNLAFAVHPVGGHAAAQGAGLPASLSFVAHALEGTLLSNWTCGSDPFGHLHARSGDPDPVLPEPSLQQLSQLDAASTPWGAFILPSA